MLNSRIFFSLVISNLNCRSDPNLSCNLSLSLSHAKISFLDNNGKNVSPIRPLQSCYRLKRDWKRRTISQSGWTECLKRKGGTWEAGEDRWQHESMMELCINGPKTTSDWEEGRQQKAEVLLRSLHSTRTSAVLTGSLESRMQLQHINPGTWGHLL